ncbi:MAG: hypothetical protein NVS2B7_24510 [Herpetosiphon sp.]
MLVVAPRHINEPVLSFDPTATGVQVVENIPISEPVLESDPAATRPPAIATLSVPIGTEPEPTLTPPPAPHPQYPTTVAKQPTVPLQTATMPVQPSIPKVVPPSAPPTALIVPPSAPPTALIPPPVVAQPVPIPPRVITNNGTNPVIYLTFDVEGRGAPEVLATLRANHVPATMFLVGSWATTYPALVRQMVSDGHSIGNHSLTHPVFTRLSPAAARAEIEQGEAAITRVSGISPRPRFRFPYGSGQTTPWLLQIVASEGYSAASWTIDPQDWRGLSSGAIAQSVAAHAHPGGIVLLHPASPGTPQAVQLIIDNLRARGFRFATL